MMDINIRAISEKNGLPNTFCSPFDIVFLIKKLKKFDRIGSNTGGGYNKRVELDPLS